MTIYAWYRIKKKRSFIGHEKDSDGETNHTQSEGNEGTEMPGTASLRYSDKVSSGNLNKDY